MPNLLCTVPMVEDRCCVCGQFFAMEGKFHEKMKQDGDTFHCPQGHAQHFIGPTDNDVLRERLKGAQDDLERKSVYLKDKLSHIVVLHRQRAALAGVITKLRKKYEPERFEERKSK